MRPWRTVKRPSCFEKPRGGARRPAVLSGNSFMQREFFAGAHEAADLARIVRGPPRGALRRGRAINNQTHGRELAMSHRRRFIKQMSALAGGAAASALGLNAP